MQQMIKNLEVIQSRIENAAKESQRDLSEIRLIWVSKTHPIKAVQIARQIGAKQFGENKVQEAVEKFTEKPAGEELHIIGPVQSNKIRKAVQVADYIHTVDRLDKLERIERICGEENRRLKVLFQINTSNEDSKSGIPLKEAQAFLKSLPEPVNVEYCGLMTIPSHLGEGEPLEEFKALKQLRDEFYNSSQKFAAFKELSMGMSDDLEVAIAGGATMIRIGTALFGKRDYPTQ